MIYATNTTCFLIGDYGGCLKTYASLFSGFGGGNMYTCAVCGKQFKSYNPTPKFCGRECKTQYQTANIDFGEAVRLYESGLTQVEVGAHFGVTQRAITSLFRRNKYQSHKAIKRNQGKENNHMWKGNDTSYSVFHDRVNRQRGKPSHCEICGTTDPNKKYEWASLTKNYADINDYKRMCKSCHRKFDKAILHINHMRKNLENAKNLR